MNNKQNYMAKLGLDLICVGYCDYKFYKDIKDKEFKRALERGFKRVKVIATPTDIKGLRCYCVYGSKEMPKDTTQIDLKKTLIKYLDRLYFTTTTNYNTNISRKFAYETLKKYIKEK